jgi:hypothetical protein
MTNDRWAIELIEQTERDHPRCDACGAPNVPTERHGAIWLVCSDSLGTKSFLQRLVSIGGHTRSLILDHLAYDQVA